ncbi:UPF0173 metal-dependent hydrolase -like protein [Cladobotryum mycophilum]|uniref:UPF0173 metal-dependent hydrolase -like protein n=1 Tax=Cladobotryum mycophilum TaxID=491253 RepID=A0ABR0SKM1_9HYPO
MSSSFKSSVHVTFIGTATAILEVDGINFLTDPFFSPLGTEWDLGILTLKNSYEPPLGLQDLPVIDAVFLSHEDHPDNLDEIGRRLLDGRRVLTTNEGAANLAPRPGVRGLKPWETVPLNIGGRHFEVTATPCKHAPVGECIGFVLSAAEFGSTNGLPNAIYFSGDTVYIEELAEIGKRFHISLALVNLGSAAMPISDPPLQITMDGEQAVRLVREINADLMIPMHFEGWGHFTEGRDALKKVFGKEDINDKVRWLAPGERQQILG